MVVGAPARLTLVRHGETPANRDGVWHGSIDTPLTERGRAQAARVAAWAGRSLGDAVAIYASPLQRARHTAAGIAEALDLELRLEADLSEYDLGEWEGRSYRELLQEHDLFRRMERDPDWAPPGGESPRQVVERFTAALQRIAAAHPETRVIVVAHGGALTLTLTHLLGAGASWSRPMDNCGVSEIALHPKPSMLFFNRTDHLADL